MSKRPTRQTRRRTKSASRTPFYLGLGVLALLGVIAIIYFITRGTNTTGTGDQIKPVTAPVGKTADGYWYKGDPNAPIKLEIYADYQCPSCATLENSLQTNNFDETYVNTGKVQIIYRELPLIQIHKWSIPTAEIARCAGDQDKFWLAHDVIYSSQKEWVNAGDATPIILDKLASVGINKDQLNQCFTAGTHKADIETALAAATAKNLASTPSVFINGVAFNNDVPTMMRAIDNNLGTK